MLHIIQGESGTGKTRYLYELFSQLAKDGCDKLLYLIPEQSSFKTETDFLHLLGAKLCGNVKVMSFTRLYNMVISSPDTDGLDYIARVRRSCPPIDDGVRGVMMSLTLEDCADTLELYAGQVKKPRFAKLMLDAVKEFKTCGITGDELREISQKDTAANTQLAQKLRESAIILDVYNAHIEKSCVDPLDNNARLEKCLSEVNIFSGWTVAVDDFSGFTAQEQKVLDLLLAQCDDMYVSLCMSAAAGQDNDEDLFYTVRKTRERVIRGAQSAGVKVASPVVLAENCRTTVPSLAAVTHGIYRPDAAADGDTPSGSGMTVCETYDVFEECEYVCERIKKLTLGGGYRYKDIAVVFRDANTYSGILDASLDSHGIPFFMSRPERADTKPLMMLVTSAMEYTLTPSDTDKLFALAKCGLSGLSDYEIGELENYAYIWRLGGRRFQSEFTENPDGYSGGLNEEKLMRLNDIRERLMAPLIAFSAKVKCAAADESTENNGKYATDAQRYSAAVYELLEDYNVPAQIQRDAYRSAEEVNPYAWAGEQDISQGVRLWEVLCDILDKLVLSLGERRVTLKRYCELFKSMSETVDLSDIPQTLDQVIVSSADSARLSSPKAVFVMGAVEGVFPHTPVASGIFSDSERRGLIELDLPMYDAQAQLALHEKYLVYTAVSAPTERLYVTYYTHAPDGSASERSSVVSELLRVLPSLTVKRVCEQAPLDRVYCEKTAFECCAALYRQNGALSRALKKYFSGKEEYSGRLNALDRAVSSKDFTIDSEVSGKLFGTNKNLSPSQIEKFYTCRFQYLCGYGLKLSERRRAEINTLEYGTLVHYMLENILKRCEETGKYILSDEELDALLDELLDKYIKEYMGGTDEKTDRFVYLYNRLSDSIRRLSVHLGEELDQSGFKPAAFELAVGKDKHGNDAHNVKYGVTDAHGNTVSIRGKIDRVDTMESDKRSYVRVIDYKTGKKEFKLEDVLSGLNMQMLIYLMAIAKGKDADGAEADFYKTLQNDEICPSGILYVPAKVKSVSAQPGDTDEKIEKEHSKNLRMNGLILDEPQVLRAMDSEGNGKYIPVSLNKDGSAKPSRGKDKKCVVSMAQLNMIFEIVENHIRRMSETLDDGRFKTRKAKASFKADSEAAADDLNADRERAGSDKFAQAFPDLAKRVNRSGSSGGERGNDEYCGWCPYKAVCGE